jgi:hypothetical protein
MRRARAVSMLKLSYRAKFLDNYREAKCLVIGDETRLG